ncbi:hypothetical protein LOS07_18535, partial [Proteus mirabilis]|nr:hypothetical protein [Proteus mirabilis]
PYFDLFIPFMGKTHCSLFTPKPFIKQLNNKKPRLGELFSHLLSRNKIIKEDSVDITLKLNKGQLVSLGGECSYNFY